MDMVLRAGAIYLSLWLIFRLTQRRTMSEATPFDFVLLLICGEAVQGALLGSDLSLTGAIVVVVTLVALDGAATTIRARFKSFERVMEGVPVVVMRDGKLLTDRLLHEKIDEDDILRAARLSHGIDRLDDIRSAVLESNGHLSIIPARR